MIIRFTIFTVACLTLVLGAFQNCSPYHAKGSSSASSLSDTQMAEKFSLTLQPVLVANCASCHGVSQSPMFAVADATSGMNAILQNGLVDLASPASSALVAKISGGHSGLPTSLAVTLQSAIQAWSDAIGTPPPVTADTQAPAVMISAPAAGATLVGSVSISAVATDNVAVVGVQFYVDGIAQGSEVLVSPFTLALNTASKANGAHTLSARARDAAGNMATSAIVNVTVSNVVSDTVSPTVSITAPAAAASVSGSVTISANANDNVGVLGVQFYVDGVASGVEDTAAPYSVLWNATLATNGGHSLTARARDAAGNMTTSAAVAVTVTGGIAPLNPLAKFSWISANILVPKCVGCHGPVKADKGVRYDTYAATILTAKAGNLTGSKLYTTTRPGGSMPPGSTKLSATDVQAISDWISAGALNN